LVHFPIIPFLSEKEEINFLGWDYYERGREEGEDDTIRMIGKAHFFYSENKESNVFFNIPNLLFGEEGKDCSR
jgi:hypothetical protein